MTFEIKNTREGSWAKGFYYVLKGKNGEIMLTSEMMKSKQSCKKSIRSIKRSVGLFSKVVDSTR